MSEFRYSVEIVNDHRTPSWLLRVRDNEQLITLLEMIEDNLDPNYEVYIKAGDFAEYE